MSGGNAPEQALDIDAERLAGALLSWYDQHARALPWRSDPAPYRVWVSEAMLQQTRVETVLPYFARFLAALPDIRALAEVDDAALMKLWEGLGYYSRARNLKRAARIVVERHGGALPASAGALRALPGVGDYMAGAVASIAFGLPEPAVDGNVIRVLARVSGFDGDVTKPEARRAFREAAVRLLPPDRPGDFNQALMDLGATVCLPNGAPRCTVCPWEGACAAHRQGREAALPVKRAKKPRPVQERTVFVVKNKDRTLLVRRPDKGLLAGQWELPGADGRFDCVEALDYLRRLGADVQGLERLPGAKHVFTHVEWRMAGWLAEVSAFAPEGEHVWADARALRDSIALPSAFKAFRRFLIEQSPQ
jgi:A/G-specific adenine glycosylase